jgi:hypothetical protein
MVAAIGAKIVAERTGLRKVESCANAPFAAVLVALRSHALASFQRLVQDEHILHVAEFSFYLSKQHQLYG